MGYSDIESMVRVSFFKTSGKWYQDEVIDMNEQYNNPSIHDAVRLSILKSFDGVIRYEGMTAVCLDPYHVHQHPVMLINWDSKL